MTNNSFQKFLSVGKCPQPNSHCRKASKEMSSIQNTYYYVSEPFDKKLLHLNLFFPKALFLVEEYKMVGKELIKPFLPQRVIWLSS